MNIRVKLYNIYKKRLSKEIIGFFIAGITSNLISFLTYIILANYFLKSIFLGAIIGQVFGVLTNYLVNSRFVFMKRLTLNKKFMFFAYYFSAIYIVGIMIEKISSYGFEYRISWLICIAIATFFNFIFLKFFAFKK